MLHHNDGPDSTTGGGRAEFLGRQLPVAVAGTTNLLRLRLGPPRLVAGLGDDAEAG